MHIKVAAIGLAVLLVSVRGALAQYSVTLSSMPYSSSPQVLTQLGSSLSAGWALRVGTFDTSGGNSAVISTSTSFATLNDLFTPVLEGGSAGGTLSSNPSAYYATVNDAFGNDGAFFQQIDDVTLFAENTPLHLWVFNSADPGSATEWGIFSGSGWMVPASFATVVMDTASIDSVLRGSFDGSNFRLSSVVVVPEPSGAVLLMSGTLLLGFWRGRRVPANRSFSLCRSGNSEE